MKKLLVFVLAALLLIAFSGIAMAVVSDTHDFTFQCEVQKYIEVNSGAVKSCSIPAISPYQDGSGPIISYSLTQREVAYANCPFRVDYNGRNDAGDNLPILARLEVGSHSGGFDRLWTRLEFHTIVNGVWNGAVFGNHSIVPQQWAWNRNYVIMNEAPHDGEVGLCLKLGASLPHETPQFNTDNTWQESADAGTYQCYVQATYTAL